MDAEVSAIVPPEPYAPPPAWPGLVTVTVTVPGVATADAGMAAVSCFPLTKVVFEPFQLTIASELKPLPLTVKMNAGLPAFALFGTSSVITGIAPGCGVGAIELPHPTHPEISIASNNTEIVFMTFSNRALTGGVPLLLKLYKALFLFPRAPRDEKSGSLRSREPESGRRDSSYPVTLTADPRLRLQI